MVAELVTSAGRRATSLANAPILEVEDRYNDYFIMAWFRNTVPINFCRVSVEGPEMKRRGASEEVAAVAVLVEAVAEALEAVGVEVGSVEAAK